MKKYYLPSEILEKYRSELIDLVSEKIKWLDKMCGLSPIVTEQLVDIKFGEEWYRSLVGAAKAAEYLCNLCINYGDGPISKGWAEMVNE